MNLLEHVDNKMPKGIQRNLLIGCIVVFQGLFVAANAEAGPILDWLFQTHTTNYPAIPVVGAVGDSCNACAPQVSQQTTVHYVPQTHYRTTWARVPVTTYRPITNVDPCTGCPVTCMKPCTSYSWQAQRVPYTTFRPVYSTVTVAKPCLTTCNSCATPTVVGSPVVSSGCSGCGNPSYTYSAPTYGTADPYYGTTAPAMPATSAPMTVPITPTPAPMNSTPMNSAPMNSAPMNSGPMAPADQAPNLDPSGIQHEFQGSNTPLFNYPPREMQPASRNQLPTTERAFSTPRTNDAITPVPDPDAQLDGIQPIEPAPQLLNPRDKTATTPVRRAWAYSPVKVSCQIETTPAAGATLIESSQDDKWDSSGWHSVNN